MYHLDWFSPTAGSIIISGLVKFPLPWIESGVTIRRLKVLEAYILICHTFIMFNMSELRLI